MLFTDKIKHILNNQKSVSLRFLTIYEQTIIQSLCRNQEVQFDGGYEDSEKKRAYFFDEDMNNTIVCFQIVYPEKHLTIQHQNILGTLMSLSITADSIGDILPKQGVFFVTSEIEDEITRSFTAINGIPIELKKIDGRSVKKEQDYEYFDVVSDSLRLDLIVSKIAKISRNDAFELIEKEHVKINQIVITKHTKQVQDQDILSIRRFGRFQILDTSGTTRKQKIVVKYRKFV